MYEIYRSTAFKKDIKILKKRGKNFDKLKAIIIQLASNISLEQKNRDHKLSGNWDNFRECHIEPDWLLIYKIIANTLELARTGTHSDLFGK